MKDLKKLLFLSGVFLILISPLGVHADSDGSLQLNSDMITNQSGGTSSVSDFAIRSQLFSKDLEAKVEEKSQKEANATKSIQNADFNQRQLNRLYQVNHQNVKTELFIHYGPTGFASDETYTQNATRGMLILLFLAVPLLVLTGFVAKRFARRKRRK